MTCTEALDHMVVCETCREALLAKLKNHETTIQPVSPLVYPTASTSSVPVPTLASASESESGSSWSSSDARKIGPFKSIYIGWAGVGS
jgi:hypothetical protein